MANHSSFEKEYAADFLKFANASPSPYHAVDQAAQLLKAKGYVQISEVIDDNWKQIKPNGRYFLTRNQSTLVAFAVGGQYKPGNGFSIVGAHTDSPCLKVKPISNVTKQGFQEVGVECYGGGLWHTWFDRDLSVAGRVMVGNDDQTHFESKLVRIDRPIMRIPTLAIHLNREVDSNGFVFNKENHLLPILCSAMKAQLSGKDALGGDLPEQANHCSRRHHPILLKLLAEQLQVEPQRIEDFELCVYDTQPGAVGGALDEFIFTARIDNLLMSWCGLRALLNSDDTLDSDSNVRMVALFDNEEVGSATDRGADSNMMLSILRRISGDAALDTAIRRSLLISADCAHAVHPNYADKHEERNRPHMHQGLVIKENANQRYASNSVTAFFVRHLAQKHQIKTQEFCVRNDSACGSTIGPILASGCGMRTVDVGIGQFSMHSIREQCGTEDLPYAVHLIQAFFDEFAALDNAVKVD